MTSCAWAQIGQITGSVTSAEDASPVAGAIVRLLATNHGAIARADGTFSLRNVRAGIYRLSIASLGFESIDTSITLASGDSVHLEIVMEPKDHEAEEVVVTGTRLQRTIDDVPIRVEAVPQEEVEEKILMSPANVSMLLNESTGMRIQTTSPTTATANLRIQGLPGRYTQVLTDGIPNVGGLSAGLGLTELPPLNLRQVEIIKGAASALYGADAIAGVVNFITKDPRAELELSSLVNVTSQLGVDVAAYVGQKHGDLGYTLMVSRNSQPRVDVDDDGFADVTEYERYTVYPKLQYALSGDVDAELGFGFISDDRLGGSANAPREAIGLGSPYLEHVHSQRISGTAAAEWRVDEGQALRVEGAGLGLSREATYGNVPFDATQVSFYGEATFSAEFERHSLVAGAVLNTDQFKVLKSGPSFNGVAVQDYSYVTTGAFFQQEVQLLDQLTAVSSVRIDIHNVYGSFFTPRISLMYRPSEELTFRVGGGTGFKVPTIFVEDAEESGFEEVELDINAEPEQAQNATFDVNWKFILADEVGCAFNAAAYLTRVQNALIVTRDDRRLDPVTFIRNADGNLLSRGAELSTKFNYDDFKLSIGYTYLYATQEDGGARSELALNPRHSLGAVLMWESEQAGMKVGFETYWTGHQRLEDHPTRTMSPSYAVMGLLVEKALGSFRLFINFENFTDTRQTRFERIVTGNPDLERVHPLPIYAPLEGRVINGGVRFVLP